MAHTSSELKSLEIAFPEPRFIYDDVAMYFTHRFRRRGEFIQRPRLITAGIGEHEQHPPEEHHAVVGEGEPEPEADADGEGPRIIVELDEEDPEDGGPEILIQEAGDGIGEEQRNLQAMLQSQGMTEQDFRLLPQDLQQDILQNFAIASMDQDQLRGVLG